MRREPPSLRQTSRVTNLSERTAVPVPDAPRPGAPRPDAEEPVRPTAPPAPPRQRWRLYVAQPAADEPDRRPGEGGRGWAAILASTPLPLAGEGSRVRVAPAAPLPLGIAGEREVVDVYLVERRTIAEVRAAVGDALPPAWRLVDLHDVWVGAPAAPAAVVAADYRVVVVGAARWELESAVLALLAAGALPRERRREKRTTTYDLRPLVLDLRVGGSGAGGATLAMRLRHAPDAVGRPEEVVAALEDLAAPAAGGRPAALVVERPAVPVPHVEVPVPGLAPGPALVVRSLVRERLVMAGDPDAPERR